MTPPSHLIRRAGRLWGRPARFVLPSASMRSDAALAFDRDSVYLFVGKVLPESFSVKPSA